MATIIGTAGDDTLTGTDPDPFFGTGGDDTISGLGGNDIIDGRGGVNQLFGEDGNDTFRFTYTGPPPTGSSSSRIDGGAGYDTLDFSTYNGFASISIIRPDSSNQAGNPGDLAVNAGTSAIATGIERVIGTTGRNSMSFSAPVEAFGGAAVDNFFASNGAIVRGLGGNDEIEAGNGGTGFGGSGNDRLKLTGVGALYGDDGDDTGFLGRVGNVAELTVSGGLIDGGAGADTLQVGFGDTVDLMAGTLTRPMNGNSIVVPTINFENVNTDYSGGPDSLTTVYGTDGVNVMDFFGSVFNMPRYPVRFYGRGGDDILTGFDGIDIIDGGDGDDRISGAANNNILIGGSGIDTAVLRQDFASYSLAFFADRIEATGTAVPGDTVLYGPGREGINRLYGIERIQFRDALIDRVDSTPLVDDIYYLANNRDVFAAKADPDAHYAAFGWKEGRDPNALFDTSGYLDANRDVAAAKTNPLDHYLQFGAHEGRDPSALFDSEQYLARNPDVAAFGINPLVHYLANGQAEGRVTYAAVGNKVVDDFDAEYYLLTNPDVAAAGADPLAHFDEYGWREGRDPNAYFDTGYYLANNADVSAANVNPLDHFTQYGWREGRDPSVQFDTSYYLTHNTDIAAAGIDPLQHYLTYGRLEGRDIGPSGAGLTGTGFDIVPSWESGWPT